MDLLKQILQQHFGFSEFRTGQEAVVSNVLSGVSAAAIFPTGSGKSLCYQLPATQLPNLTLVISPLLALMQDQVQFLNRIGINAASIDSSLSKVEVNQIMNDVRSGQIKILMVAVERLKNERFRQFIQQVPISLMVVDEAHCISEWGHNFRPDYLKLPYYQQEFNIPQVLLLTATATPDVIKDMASKFNIDVSHITVTGFYRSNLNLAVEGVSEANKLIMLEQWLFHEARYKPVFDGDVRQKKDHTAYIDPTIIYVTLQQTAMDVASELKTRGFNVSPYHAGMNSEDRQIIQTDFMAGNIDIIVATIAFGMGIDKANIRHVVHYDLPKSIENYSQEVGRAGRDGNPSDCLVLVNKENLNVLENFVYGDTPEQQGIESVLNNILENEQNGRWETQMYTLSSESNIKQLPLKTLLVQLEMAGVIKPLYAYFAEYKFKLLVSAEDLVGRFDGERQSFVKAILDYSKEAKVWWTADIEAICQQYQPVGEGAQSYQQERARVITALEYFAEQNLIELESKQMTEVYQVHKLIEPAQLAEQLALYFQQKEHSEVARIHNMLDMFERKECMSFQLASYFGDNNAPVHCGHCSVCAGHQVQMAEAQNLPPLNKNEIGRVLSELETKYQDKFSNPPSKIIKAKFLLGLTTPAFTKLRARSIKGFGDFAQYRFADMVNALPDH